MESSVLPSAGDEVLPHAICRANRAIYGQFAIVVKTLLYLHLNDAVPLCFLSFIRYLQLFNLHWWNAMRLFPSPHLIKVMNSSLCFTNSISEWHFYVDIKKWKCKGIIAADVTSALQTHLPTMPLCISAARVEAGHCCSETRLRASWSQWVCERFFSFSYQIILNWLKSYKHVCWWCMRAFEEGNNHPWLLNRGMKTRKQKSTRTETSKRKGCF